MCRRASNNTIIQYVMLIPYHVPESKPAIVDSNFAPRCCHVENSIRFLQLSFLFRAHLGEADETVAYRVLRKRDETQTVVRQDLLQSAVTRLSRLPRQTTA